jgi:hypothetical protein
MAMKITSMLPGKGLAVIAAVSVSAAVAANGAVQARTVKLLTQEALSEQAALTVAQGALDKCHADGYHVSVIVLDASGLIKVQVRADGTARTRWNMGGAKRTRL